MTASYLQTMAQGQLRSCTHSRSSFFLRPRRSLPLFVAMLGMTRPLHCRERTLPELLCTSQLRELKLENFYLPPRDASNCGSKPFMFCIIDQMREFNSLFLPHKVHRLKNVCASRLFKTCISTIQFLQLYFVFSILVL